MKPFGMALNWRFASLCTLTLALRLSAALWQGPPCALELRNGTIFALTNRLTGEHFSAPKLAGGSQAALHRPGKPLLEVQAAVGLDARNYLKEEQQWGGIKARWSMRVDLEPDSGDALITQKGQTGDPGLSGISWGISSIPDDFEILVPGTSGQRFDASSPAGRREFNYPLLWEAPFILIQGREGGWMVRAEDPQYRFKNLIVDHARGTFRLRFESRNFAPFEDKHSIQSSRWRITAYRGPWQNGAALYRRYAEKRYRLIPLPRQQPAWVRDIQFVVTMNLQSELLPELARRCEPPKTLLYLPNWRRDEYDRNYPDYTASTNLAPFVAAAHQLGFRVMPHVNYASPV
jgi:hypothetical protein